MAAISTEAAVEQLHQMFGDYDKETLSAILQANGGNMERTVEQLLGNPSGGSDTGVGGGGGVESSSSRTDHDAALALQLSREWGDDPTTAPPPPTRPVGIPSPYDRPAAGGGDGGGVSAVVEKGSAQGTCSRALEMCVCVGLTHTGGTSGRRGRRVALPENFLRLPGWHAGGEGSGDPQVAADARLAMMLQNQSFQRELQAHPDLAFLGRPLGAQNTSYASRGRFESASGPTIREQLTAMGNDVRRELDKFAVRWKMKNPGRVEDTTGDHGSSVPLMSAQGDDFDDQAEVVHFSQDSATRRSHATSTGAAGSFAVDSGGDELLADPRRSKKDR
ncbi:unnamed protein product [Ascophyllum nodosum]